MRIPTLEEARKQFYASERTTSIILSTIEKATNEYPEWAKISPEYPSKATPASGALIEGFGAFLGQLADKKGDKPELRSGVNRNYVLALEAVLVTEKPTSPIAKDVIGWMKEEKESFPEPIQLKIDQLS